MDLKSKHSYQTQSFLWLLGFSWLLIVCFVGFQYHREKELRTELLDSQLQIINAQLEEALSNARTPHDFFDAHLRFPDSPRHQLALYGNRLTKKPHPGQTGCGLHYDTFASA